MEVLLVIFIGMVAVALVIIAAGIGAVAWYLSRLLMEINIIVRQLHSAGEGGAQFIYQIAKNIWPKKTKPKKSPPPQE